MKKYNCKKVLVGDYNALSRKITLDVLNEFDLNIDIVTSGSELIDKIKQGFKYDIIFTNNTYLDCYDGRKIINILKEIPNFDTPIVVCTIERDKEYLIEVCKFDDYIYKPLDTEKVKPILDKFLK